MINIIIKKYIIINIIIKKIYYDKYNNKKNIL
jgi:hypothetical protein